MAYTKLDGGITESTIWQAPDTTRLVWITMLALADQNGYVGASMPGLASRARVSLDACIAAIATLEAPDEWSRTKANDGRRVAAAEGGWVLLNHALYRARQSAEDRRERSRIAMKTLRDNRRQQALTVNNRERSCSGLIQAEAEAEARNTLEPTALVVSAAPKLPACPTEDIIALYHELLPMLPAVQVVNAGRKRMLSARWREVVSEPEAKAAADPRAHGLAWFRWYFKRAAESKFLTGKVKDWRADFDFLITPSKFAKVVEGNYDKDRP